MLNTTLKCIRSDRGTEFFNKAEKKYLEDLGIEHQSLLPYSQQQNGRAECYQQTILNKAESLRHQAGLSEGFWKFAVMAAIYIYNQTPFARADWKTPYELWFGNQPNVLLKRKCILTPISISGLEPESPTEPLT